MQIREYKDLPAGSKKLVRPGGDPPNEIVLFEFAFFAYKINDGSNYGSLKVAKCLVI